MPSINSEEDLSLLRQKMHQYFSIEELRTLCFDLGVDPEELGGINSSKSILIINLIAYLMRRDRLESLIQGCENVRPHVSWRTKSITNSPPNQASHFSLSCISGQVCCP